MNPPAHRLVVASPGALRLCGLALLAVLFAAGQAGSAEDPAGEADAADRAQREARRLVGAIRLELVEGSERTRARVLEQPVLRFGDTPRNNEAGSAWIWVAEGRPAAILELYRNAGPNEPWVSAASSLSTSGLEADVGEDLPKWSTRDPGIAWKEFAGAPVPAERAVRRARQIKELAGRFEAHQFWDPDNQRYELRLLVRPLYQYGDDDSRVPAGAVFALSHGTNPEVVLIIEAFGEAGEEPRFRYALARLGHAEMHVSFDGREVWSQPRLNRPGPSEPYWLYIKPGADSEAGNE